MNIKYMLKNNLYATIHLISDVIKRVVDNVSCDMMLTTVIVRNIILTCCFFYLCTEFY